MASFRSLTADGQPLEDFRKAVPKANGIQTPPQTPSLHVHLFEWSQSSQDGTESSGLKSIEELESQNTSTVRVLFAPRDTPQPETVDGLVELFRKFDIPSAFVAESLQHVSQSFAAQKDVDGTTYVWFHFLCKDVAASNGRIVHVSEGETDPLRRRAQQQSHANFTWLKPGFVLKIKGQHGPAMPSRTRTSSSDATMAVALTRPRVELFCFGAPVALRDRFQKMVGVAICDDLLQDPYALLEIVLEEMYKVLDLSGWTVSTIFGDMERDVLDMASTPGKASELSRDHFTGLHNLARHTIYLRENCESALATLGGLYNYHRSVVGDSPTPSQAFTRQALEYRKTLFQSTQRRLESLDKRMSNIIQLSFHLVTQGDSRMMQTENQSMKTIAVMTLFFMPLGTVASIFGTQFMQIQEEAPYHITVSRDFWLMWLIAVPLTIVVVVIWRVWYRDARGRLVDEIPPRAKDERGYMGWKELRQAMLKDRHAMRADKESA